MQTLYRKDADALDVWIEYFEEISTERINAVTKLEQCALRGEITIQQFKVLKGLVEHNDVEGAMKGLYKILRRNKKRCD